MKQTCLLLFLFFVLGSHALAQTEPVRVDQLERRITTLEKRIQQAGDQGLALFLFGTFCALWAQQTGRNSWLWFFLGLFFSIITVLVLLSKNADDRKVQAKPAVP
jgi:hypothetical protein